MNNSSYIYPKITIKILQKLQDETYWQEKNDIDKFLDIWEAGRSVSYMGAGSKFGEFVLNLLIKTGHIVVKTEKLYPNSVLHDVYRLSLSHVRSMIQDMVIRPYSGKYKRA